MGQGAGGSRRRGPVPAPEGLRSQEGVSPGANLARQVLAYDPRADGAMIEAAWRLAEQAHASQKREDGQPYIVHPLAVASILADYRLDGATVATALLHDVVEDTGVSLAEIEKRFGKEVARLVDGVTKLTRLELQSERTKQAENFRKLVLAMSEDIRVLIVKLADRLHNMRTLSAVAKPEKRVRTARETLEIYAPLAERIGMDALKTEIETLSFREMNPDAWQTIAARLTYLRGQGADLIEEIEQDLKRVLRESGIEPVEVQGREKSPYSIWLKMQRKNVAFEQLSDIMAFRVVVKDKGDCYGALGAIHSAYRVVPGRFKDWISTPKTNGYQSVHTGVTVPERRNAKIEVQIRTPEMHDVAEYGVAAHWVYKQGDDGARTRRRYPWVRDLLEILKSAADPQDFLDHTKLELHRDQVFCFTPKGDLIELPRGATPVDFAYQVHSQVGDNTVGAKVNGKIVPLRHTLEEWRPGRDHHRARRQPEPGLGTLRRHRQGARTHPPLRPCPPARRAAGGRARGDRQGVPRHRARLLGKGAGAGAQGAETAGFRGAVRRRGGGASLGARRAPCRRARIARPARTVDQMPLARPRGRLGAGPTLTAGKAERPGSPRREAAMGIAGLVTGMAVHFAGCCHPLPGDRIVGIVTTGRGVTIHKHDCHGLEAFAATPERFIDVDWEYDDGSKGAHVGRIELMAENSSGALAGLTTAIARQEGAVNNLRILNRSGEWCEVLVDVEVRDTGHLAAILAALRACPGVTQVERARG